MDFHFVYILEYQRFVYGIILDSRSTISLLHNKTGFQVRDYIEGEINKINDETLIYSIESDMGNLAGYFTLIIDRIKRTAIVGQYQLRPAYLQLDTQISQQISNFITANEWKKDFLF